MRTALLLFACTLTASAQWQLQDSHSTADLRGIDNVGNGIAWASGSNGTVLRTTDNGTTWQRCTTPADADKLDFRGVQAFDAQTAIVMSSGKGDLSRLYKTTDGCQTWTLVLQNPEKDGFWDAIQAISADEATVLGDSVNGSTRLFVWDSGQAPVDSKMFDDTATGDALPGESSFAASNSVLEVVKTEKLDPIWKFDRRWVSNTPTSILFHYRRHEETPTCEPCRGEEGRVQIRLKRKSASAGIFSFNFRTELNGVMVGGDFARPDQSEENAAFTTNGGILWQAAKTPPNGYRSAVAYDAATKTWITVGPNGTDVSTDDGRNWRALKPSTEDAADADKNWNALSLPFVVGPKGRIGVMEAGVLQTK